MGFLPPGFIGRAVVERLVARGDTVVALVRDPAATLTVPMWRQVRIAFLLLLLAVARPAHPRQGYRSGELEPHSARRRVGPDEPHRDVGAERQLLCSGHAGLDRRLLHELLPTLVDILHWHRRGTGFGIRVDTVDGLLDSLGAWGVLPS